jgi:hypothetical protein
MVTMTMAAAPIRSCSMCLPGHPFLLFPEAKVVSRAQIQGMGWK